MCRPVEARDLERIRRLRNDQSTWAYLTDGTQISPAMQEKWFANISEALDRCYLTVTKINKDFPIIHEGNFLGIIRMDCIDVTNRSVRIGADVVPQERGKGYGTKIYKMLLKYCFDCLNYHRLWLCVLDTNKIAIKLYSNVGFFIEGVMKEAVFRDGK